MNREDVVNKVSERSGVDREQCEMVLKALEKVLQDELSAGGLGGALGKISGVLNILSGK